tara:strand:+ start:1234 stop:1698 length:465 start_codon:yes stop_codon:yes gene_type:complete
MEVYATGSGCRSPTATTGSSRSSALGSALSELTGLPVRKAISLYVDGRGLIDPIVGHERAAVGRRGAAPPPTIGSTLRSPLLIFFRSSTERPVNRASSVYEDGSFGSDPIVGDPDSKARQREVAIPLLLDLSVDALVLFIIYLLFVTEKTFLYD